MKKLWILILVVALLLAACGTEKPAESTGGTEPIVPQPTETTQVPTLPQITVENPVNYLLISYTDAQGTMKSLTAYDDGSGKAHVEYVGDVKKVGDLDLAVLHNIAQAVADAGCPALNGQSVFDEGVEFASMYVSYPDESYLGADYSGVVSQEFLDCYGKLDDFFRQLTAGLEIYVPQPLVMEGVDPAVLETMLDILNHTGMEYPDSLYISNVPMDEFFGPAMGLTKTEGILSGTGCSPMMSGSAYSFVMVRVAENADRDAICADFAAHLEWNKWVCVSASDAMIARKGDMILCLMATGELYEITANAIREADWENIETYENPAM